MRFPALSGRLLVWLLVLALSAGLGVPAFAGTMDNGQHTPAVTAAHGACLHGISDAGQQSEPDSDASGTPAAADCALAHLGNAVLDRLTSYSVRITCFAYPPAFTYGSTGQEPGLEGDPPRPARTA